jgi:hypothetical protein
MFSLPVPPLARVSDGGHDRNVIHIITLRSCGPPCGSPGGIATTVLLGATTTLFRDDHAKDTKTISKIRPHDREDRLELRCIKFWGSRRGVLADHDRGPDRLVGHPLSALPLRSDTAGLTLLGTAGAIYLALDTFDLSLAPPVAWLHQTVVPTVVGMLGHTFLGTWKQGFALRVLEDRSLDLALAAFKGTAALSFLAVLPWVHQGVRQRVSGALRRSWWRRTG